MAAQDSVRSGCVGVGGSRSISTPPKINNMANSTQQTAGGGGEESIWNDGNGMQPLASCMHAAAALSSLDSLLHTVR